MRVTPDGMIIYISDDPDLPKQPDIEVTFHASGEPWFAGPLVKLHDRMRYLRWEKTKVSFMVGEKLCTSLEELSDHLDWKDPKCTVVLTKVDYIISLEEFEFPYKQLYAAYDIVPIYCNYLCMDLYYNSCLKKLVPVPCKYRQRLYARRESIPDSWVCMGRLWMNSSFLTEKEIDVSKCRTWEMFETEMPWQPSNI